MGRTRLIRRPSYRSAHRAALRREHEARFGNEPLRQHTERRNVLWQLLPFLLVYTLVFVALITSASLQVKLPSDERPVTPPDGIWPMIAGISWILVFPSGMGLANAWFVQTLRYSRRRIHLSTLFQLVLAVALALAFLRLPPPFAPVLPDWLRLVFCVPITITFYAICRLSAWLWRRRSSSCLAIPTQATEP